MPAQQTPQLHLGIQSQTATATRNPSRTNKIVWELEICGAAEHALSKGRRPNQDGIRRGHGSFLCQGHFGGPSFVMQKGITSPIALKGRHGRNQSQRKPQKQQQEFGIHLTTKLFDYRGATFTHSVDGATLAGVCWNIERIAVRDHFGMPRFICFFCFSTSLLISFLIVLTCI